jgi:hypothetical protein
MENEEVGLLDGVIEDDESIDEIAAKTWADIQARDIETPEKTPDPNPETTPAEQKEATPTEQAEAIKAPSSWKKELQGRFSELPAEFQQEIQKREDDFHRGIAQYKQAAEFVKQLEPIAPALQQLHERYGNSIQPIGQLVQLDSFANNDPVGFIQWFAKSKGIALDGTGIENAQQNPMLQTLQQQVQQLSGYVQNQRQSQEQNEQQQALSAIEQFKNSGKAENFDILREDMAALLQSGLASTIEDAYERALWQRQDLRQGLIAKQLKSEQEKAKKAALEAKKAASVNVTQRGKSPNKASDDPAEIVRQKAAELGF